MAQTTHNAPPTPQLSEHDANDFIQELADSFGSLTRSPVLHWPDEEGLDYEDVTFPSDDGIPLEGWFIPADSDRLLVVNHPMGFTRSGLPSNLDPWRSAWASSGNDFEVNLVPDYKILHDAGYNVLCYDLRNHGLSGSANGAIASSGIFESRDVLGSLAYIRRRADTRDMTLGMLSRCLGCNSTFNAMMRRPEAFDDVRCLLAPEPVSTSVITERQMALAGVPDPAARVGDLAQRVKVATGIDFPPRDPLVWARHVCVPTYLYQVHDDVLTRPSDVQGMFDNIPVRDKELEWIYGTSARWDGYLDLQRNPAPKLAWLERHMV